MWNNGTKIIKYLFKKRSDSPKLCHELASRTSVDSDRSDISMFEIGLSTERHGNYEYGTSHAAREDESQRLISIAKEQHLFIPKSDWTTFGERKRTPSGESIVYLTLDGNSIIKIRDPFAKAPIKNLHSQDVIYEHIIHNILFPNTRYSLVGISEDFDGVRIILKQEYLKLKFSIPSQKEIDDYLKALGLSVENRYFYGNEYVSITDVSAAGDNVLSDGHQLFFIDPIIKFKKPAIEVIEYYYQLLK